MIFYCCQRKISRRKFVVSISNSIYRVIKNLLTPLWEHICDVISNGHHLFIIPVNTFWEFPWRDWKMYIFLWDFLSLRIFELLSSFLWIYSQHFDRYVFWPKLCECNNGDEDNSLNFLRDKNHQTSSQKFRQISVGESLLEKQNCVDRDREQIETLKSWYYQLTPIKS